MSSFFRSFRSSKRQFPAPWSDEHKGDGRADDLPFASFPTPTHYAPTSSGSYSQAKNTDARDNADAQTQLVLKLQQDLQKAQERIRKLEDRVWELMKENQVLKTQAEGSTTGHTGSEAQPTSHAEEDGADPNQRTNDMSMMDGRDDDAQPVYKDYWPPVALQGVSITADSKSKKASSNPVGSSNSAEVPEVKMKTWTEYARMDITTEERRNNFIEKTYQVYPSGTQNCLRFTQSFFAKFDPTIFSLWRITGPPPEKGSIQREFITLNKINRLIQLVRRRTGGTHLFAVFDVLEVEHSDHTQSEGLFLFPQQHLSHAIHEVLVQQEFKCAYLDMFNAADGEYVNNLFGCSEMRTQLNLVRKRVFYCR